MRHLKQWFTGLFAAAVVLLLILAAAPRSCKSSGCLFCGCRHEEQWWFGIKTSDRVQETECSAWVRSIHPDHSNHVWATARTKQKNWGFTYVMGDYATAAGAVAQIHYLLTPFGKSRARDFLAKYHSQLRLAPDSLPKFLHAEFEAFYAKNSPGTTMKTLSVKLILPAERKATCGNRAILIPARKELFGSLTLQLSDGPHGIREYEHPHYVEASFEFGLEGQQFRYTGLITQADLWASNGTQVETNRPDFRDDIGQVDGMMDNREDWFYVLPDGNKHSNRLKYTSCSFGIMMEPTSLLVKCRYYDQNPGVAGMVTIYYARPLEELLLLKDTKFFYDANGVLEDFSLRDGETITLQPLRANNSVQPTSRPLGG